MEDKIFNQIQEKFNELIFEIQIEDSELLLPQEMSFLTKDFLKSSTKGFLFFLRVHKASS